MHPRPCKRTPLGCLLLIGCVQSDAHLLSGPFSRELRNMRRRCGRHGALRVSDVTRGTAPSLARDGQHASLPRSQRAIALLRKQVRWDGVCRQHAGTFCCRHPARLRGPTLESKSLLCDQAGHSPFHGRWEIVGPLCAKACDGARDEQSFTWFIEIRAVAAMVEHRKVSCLRNRPCARSPFKRSFFRRQGSRFSGWQSPVLSHWQRPFFHEWSGPILGG